MKRRPGLHGCLFGNRTKGLAVVSLACWNGTTCQCNMVCYFSCKMQYGCVGPRCRIISRLYFFNGVPFSFEAQLTGTVFRENINYSTTTPPLVLVSKKIYRMELQRLLAKGCPLASHTITLSPDLKKMAVSPLSPSSRVVTDPPGKKRTCSIDAVDVGEGGHALTTMPPSQT